MKDNYVPDADPVHLDLNEKETKTCSICQKDFDEWGNNAWPVNDGTCCNVCDLRIVIPARLVLMHKEGVKRKAEEKGTII